MNFKIGERVKVKHGIEECVSKYSGRIGTIMAIDITTPHVMIALDISEMSFYEFEIEPLKMSIHQLLRERGD